MAASHLPAATATPPSPSDLTEVQKNDLSRLWLTQTRQIVDVRSSSEAATLQSSLQAKNSYRFVIRLHAYILATLERELLVDNNNNIAEVSTDDNDPSSQSVFNQHECLESFSKLVLVSPSSSSNDLVVRLIEGRHVIPMPHEEFLTELNQFELKGKTTSEDFIRKHSFGAFLYHKPVQALTAVGSAMGLAVATLWRRAHHFQSNQPSTITTAVAVAAHTEQQQLDRFLDSCQFVVRFVHVMPKVRMMDIKTGLVGKFLSLKASVVKARPKRLRVATADFSCSKCGTLVTHCFELGRYSVPTKCASNDNCKSKSFAIVQPSARYINAQEIRLQEAQDESTAQAGRTPRQLEVELEHDLVDSCRPGDIVLVACVVEAINSAVAAGKAGKRALETSTYTLYLRGHSITTMSESSRRGKHQHGSQQVVYTQQQLQGITQLCHADHRYFGLIERRAFPFDLLVRSLCPSIIGHSEVKAGILLCLMGGTPPLLQSSDRGNSIRCNSHILIVGDPGMGKSQMLLAASQLAARSVYVGGNTSSTTGLTVTLTKEDRGETGIEAGALVLADQGICCIDEFDKMAKSHQDGLLEAMEQQQVSIAKAGVVASLPARCSVIAAANPKQGNYNMSHTVAENINMATPILSRFDLVFILRDRADKEQDRLVSNNIMNLYRGITEKQATTIDEKSSALGQSSSSAAAAAWEGEKDRLPLRDRLAWVEDFQKEPLPADLVRDYIAYAREYCKPKLTAAAAEVLRDYFMNLRYPPDGSRRRDAVPITTRQLEALIRLSQARAKACLREFVLKEDALDVVELMASSVDQVHSDEHGAVDPGRGGAGGKSNRRMRKAFEQEVVRIVGVGGECTLDDLRRVADKVNCGLGEFHTMIEDMRGTVLMKKPNGKYQVVVGE